MPMGHKRKSSSGPYLQLHGWLVQQTCTGFPARVKGIGRGFERSHFVGTFTVTLYRDSHLATHFSFLSLMEVSFQGLQLSLNWRDQGSGPGARDSIGVHKLLVRGGQGTQPYACTSCLHCGQHFSWYFCGASRKRRHLKRHHHSILPRITCFLRKPAGSSPCSSQLYIRCFVVASSSASFRSHALPNPSSNSSTQRGST